MAHATIPAESTPQSIDLDKTALLIIECSGTFLEPGGFGAALGNDVTRLQAAVAPVRAVLAAALAAGTLVIHTREGHRSDLSDAPPLKFYRGDPALRIGAPGPMGAHSHPRRARPRHHPGVYPIEGEPVIDKSGKGAFCQTDLELMLRNCGIETLLVCGVTTEVCVNTTVHEANDRGFCRILIPTAARANFRSFTRLAGLAMIKARDGIFGWASHRALAQ